MLVETAVSLLVGQVVPPASDDRCKLVATGPRHPTERSGFGSPSWRLMMSAPWRNWTLRLEYLTTVGRHCDIEAGEPAEHLGVGAVVHPIL